jgi:hypothetical protein
MARHVLNPLRRNVPEEQEELIASLTERYPDQSIRFDTGFVGSVPVQCSGRIGRRYFYFRYRHDCASLTNGSADLRRDASRAKHARRKSLRALRRGVSDDWFGSFFIHSSLRRNTALDRHPSEATWFAVINDVTGEEYAGCLEPEEAAEFFVQLMASLVRVPPRRREPSYKALRRGSSTWPMEPHRQVITKASKARR